MTYDDTKRRLLEIARQNSGYIHRHDVENDGELAANRQTVSAAAFAIAGSTNVFGKASSAGWFPYEEIRVDDVT